MASAVVSQRSYLEGKFGDRVSFNRTERKLYGHDIAEIPSLIKPLVGDTTPDAVVQPQSEEELVELVKWAVKNNVPLTPRGKATSGYGGAIPVKKGIVVDFYRMNKVVRIDPDGRTATVQAGVVWENLDRRTGQARVDPAPLPVQLPFVDSRRVAGSGRRRHRVLRGRLVL